MDTGFEITPINLTLDSNVVGKTSGLAKLAETEASKGVVKPDFSAALAEAGEGLVQSLQKAEATSIAGIKGDATTYDVASSVMEAEQSLRMAIAVRDRIVNAYLEISRMQI